VFSPFGAGTYNITFDLSGTEGVTYKLTGTQTVDYAQPTQQTVYFDNIRIDDATGGAEIMQIHEVQVWVNGSNVASNADVSNSTAYGSGTGREMTDIEGNKKITNGKIGVWTNSAANTDQFTSENKSDRYVELSFATPVVYNDLDAVVIFTAAWNQSTKIYTHQITLKSGTTTLNTTNLYTLSNNNNDTSINTNFIVKLRGPNHTDTLQLRGDYYIDGAALPNDPTNKTDSSIANAVEEGYLALATTMVSDSEPKCFATDIVYTIPTVAVYTTVAFVGNDITIENALPQGDTDAVTFTLAAGYEMTGLTLAEFTGSTTSSVNYTVENTTTDASYNGSFSLDDSGNNVFSPFGAGTYNITFDLSGSEGVTYKLTGTQVVDYGTVFGSIEFESMDLYIKSHTDASINNEKKVFITEIEFIDENGTNLTQSNTSITDYITDPRLDYPVGNVIDGTIGTGTVGQYFMGHNHVVTDTYVRYLTISSTNSTNYAITHLKLAKGHFDDPDDTTDTDVEANTKVIYKFDFKDTNGNIVKSIEADSNGISQSIVILDFTSVPTTIVQRSHVASNWNYTVVGGYPVIAFDSNNDITIENALPQGDTDKVTFAVSAGKVLRNLVVSELDGTTPVNYTLSSGQTITTGAFDASGDIIPFPYTLLDPITI